VIQDKESSSCCSVGGVCLLDSDGKGGDAGAVSWLEPQSS